VANSIKKSSNESSLSFENSNSWATKDHTKESNESSGLNENSSSNLNFNSTSNEIRGEIRRVKNIDAAIIHRWEITNGFTISLERWHHQLSKTCKRGRITTKNDIEITTKNDTEITPKIGRHMRDTGKERPPTAKRYSIAVIHLAHTLTDR
jgi:hypothetical protein